MIIHETLYEAPHRFEGRLGCVEKVFGGGQPRRNLIGNVLKDVHLRHTIMVCQEGDVIDFPSQLLLEE